MNDGQRMNNVVHYPPANRRGALHAPFNEKLPCNRAHAMRPYECIAEQMEP